MTKSILSHPTRCVLALVLNVGFLCATLCGQTETERAQEPGADSNETAADAVDQAAAIEVGKRHFIDSKILGQQREYWVHLPASYQPSPYLPQRYPVLFLLDGDVQFHAVSGIVSFMGESGWQIPEMIVVGIPHQNRTKELTPTQTINDFRPGKTSELQRDSGGGDDFLAFVTQELIPQIDSDYRTRPFRVLFGHSYGGLLGAHAFLRNQSSFQAFILADPSLWWDDRVLVKRLQRAIDSNAFDARREAVFLSHVLPYRAPGDDVLQSGFENVEASIRAFEAELKRADGVRFRSQKFPGETHHSVPIQTLYRGLLHVFEGYQFPQEYFLGQPEKIERHFHSVSKLLDLQVLPPEPMIDLWGDAFLGYDEDFQRYAIPLLQLNAANYPSSPNAHTSLGKAQMTLDDLAAARVSFEMALALDAENEEAKASLKELSRKQ
ncbi:MAG: alpha/beta hydrolase-fold protein [Planctomycetota bacterium]